MSNPNVIQLTEANFDQEVLNSSKPVLVDFWATWCGPCKMIAPIVEEIATEKAGSVVVGKVDVDENQALSARFGIRAIPTLFLFKDGEVKEQVVGGAVSKSDLLAKLESLL